MKRSSGILLPLFSIPSPYGIGTLGKEAYEFIDFLADAGQTYWQMLPPGPTGFGDSPYQSFSVYAGSPYFIDLDLLVKDGLLHREEVVEIYWGSTAERVDYEILFRERWMLLRKAFYRFDSKMEGDPDERRMYDDFIRINAGWLDDYALYMSVKKHFDMKPWHEWEDEGIRLRRAEAIERYREELKDDVCYHIFTQYLFFSQWEAMRSYAKRKGVSFIGDTPIYVSMDSADAWSSSEFLQLDEQGIPIVVGGVPPDCFSDTGQLWGNPLYDWEAMRNDGYSWWMKRMYASARMFDITRLDHFRGLESYWSIPFGETTAVSGKWMPGPGMDFIRRLKDRLPNFDIIAEDLGFLTEKVHKLVEDSGFPGMNVLQFAFGSGNCCDYLPHMYHPNSVVYIGTHDNSTVRGWFEEEATIAEREYAKEYFGLSCEEGWNWGFIRGAMATVSNLCIIQIQDYLDLPGSARINTPGTLGGNWQWRLTKDQLTDDLARKIAHIVELYAR